MAINKRIIKIGLLGILLFLGFLYFKNNLSTFSQIRKLSYVSITFLSLLILLELIVSSLAFKILLVPFGVNLNYKESFILTSLNRYANLLFLRGGPMLRAVYLKKKHNLKYRVFVLSFVFFTIIQLAVLFVSFLFLAIVFLKNIIIYYVVFISVLILLFLIFIYQTKLNKVSSANKYYKYKLGVEKIIKHFRTTLYLLVLNVVILFINSIRIQLVYRELFKNITFLQSFFMSVSGQLMVIFSLTPGALGVKELFISMTAKFVGEDFTLATVVATTDRAFSLCWVILLGSIFSFWYTKIIKKYEFKSKN